MKFKIQGEQEEVIDSKFSTVVEILGKRAIEKLIDNKTNEVLKDLNKEIQELRQRVLNLEEDMAIKRKEFIKFQNE